MKRVITYAHIFLKPYCEVVYLERTPEISTTQIKENLRSSDVRN